MTKIAFYSALIFVYTHIIGCGIWFVLKTEYLWVAPTDFGNIRSRMQDSTYFASYISDADLTLKNRTDYKIFLF